jgi:uncharacterized membrane protein YhaH (DUF805 family)
VSWYFAPLKKYADFSGRARRKEFWTFTLVNVVILFVLAVVAAMMGGLAGAQGSGAPSSGAMFLGFVFVLFYLAVLIPSLAVQVRRLHDTGKSGWWWFIQLVPFIGGIWLLVLFLLDSEAGSNQWGPNPKEETTVATSVASA